MNGELWGQNSIRKDCSRSLSSLLVGGVWVSKELKQCGGHGGADR